MYKEPKCKIGDMTWFVPDGKKNALYGMVKEVDIIGVWKGENKIFYTIMIGDNLDKDSFVCDQYYKEVPEANLIDAPMKKKITSAA